jgi:general secretion pathway protein I
MMAEDQRVALARKLTSFPLPAFAGTGSRESSVFVRTPLGPRLRGDGCTHPRTRAAGFSLLEVLVAFVILALVGTALFRLFGASLNNASLADEYSRAVLYAESRLAAAAVETPLRERSDQGASDDGRYAWSTKVESYALPGATADQERMAQMLPLRPWRLTVTVSWPGDFGGQRSLALSTVRLAMKQP